MSALGRICRSSQRNCVLIAGDIASHVPGFLGASALGVTEGSPDDAFCFCFLARAVLEGLWLRYKGETVEEDVVRERRRRLVQTVTWFLLTLLLALFIPDIGRVISLIGGLAACFIFVFPGKGASLMVPFRD